MVTALWYRRSANIQTICCANQNRQITDIPLHSSCYTVLPSDENIPRGEQGLANKLECTLCMTCRCISDAHPVNPSTPLVSRTSKLIRITYGGGGGVLCRFVGGFCVCSYVYYVSVVSKFGG